MALREQELPRWDDTQRFNHYYRFAVNTLIPAGEAGKKLRVGDPVILAKDHKMAGLPIS
jgi:uncharacterized protein